MPGDQDFHIKKLRMTELQWMQKNLFGKKFWSVRKL